MVCALNHTHTHTHTIRARNIIKAHIIIISIKFQAPKMLNLFRSRNKQKSLSNKNAKRRSSSAVVCGLRTQTLDDKIEHTLVASKDATQRCRQLICEAEDS